jgi:malate dehydrogenase
VVVGAGHVGQIAALRLCDADVFEEVVLVDVVEGLASGIALDLTHSAALGHFSTKVRGATSVDEAGSAEYVIITAGKARQPGMSRSDLIETNAAIVGRVAEEVARTSPDAVLVVVTNPLDEMTQHAWTTSGFPPERVVGMAGVLDTARFQALLSLTGCAPADQVSAVALGSHGEEMLVPTSQVSIAGRAVDVTPELTAIIDRTRASGAEVVGLLKSGSAFMAPGMSAAHMVITMKRGTREVLPAAVYATGEYGINGVYVGLPARLGPRGVEGIVELPLDANETNALREAAERIRGRLESLAKVS